MGQEQEGAGCGGRGAVGQSGSGLGEAEQGRVGHCDGAGQSEEREKWGGRSKFRAGHEPHTHTHTHAHTHTHFSDPPVKLRPAAGIG